ncbi:hypothetical protein XHV734_p0057 (plasmid) [Xanthomonas hortorum pv. vitians]|nr:hypothetical protein XJ27_22155 [Xanthomonas hortorum]QNM63822.1 hypothetical protein XHV734_p0057 [Xanthomonas hortorum pv. vitians]
MDRRTFLTLSGIGAAGLLLPNTRLIAAKQLLTPNDAARSRRLSDTALSTAKAAGANYCDVRVSNYLRQFVITSEAQVENVVNAESSGVCVLADGAWGLRHQHADSDGVTTATPGGGDRQGQRAAGHRKLVHWLARREVGQIVLETSGGSRACTSSAQCRCNDTAVLLCCPKYPLTH